MPVPQIPEMPVKIDTSNYNAVCTYLMVCKTASRARIQELYFYVLILLCPTLHCFSFTRTLAQAVHRDTSFCSRQCTGAYHVAQGNAQGRIILLKAMHRDTSFCSKAVNRDTSVFSFSCPSFQVVALETFTRLEQLKMNGCSGMTSVALNLPFLHKVSFQDCAALTQVST